MTEATVILSPNRETQRMLRHRSAVTTLARMGAKKAVLLALRAQGLKPQHFSAREIAVLTDYYLNQHRPELMAEAAETILARWCCAGLTTNSQNGSEPKSKTSTLPISGGQ